MKKIILFWLIGTICAAAMYVIRLLNQDTADLVFMGCFIAYCVFFCVTLVICIAFGGIPESSKDENLVFSSLIITAVAIIEYIICKWFATCALYYSVPAALLSGASMVWLAENARKKLHQMSRFK